MTLSPTLSAPPPRHSRWLIANLLAQLAFGLLAMTLALPSMQDWPAQFGASQAAVQLTFSGYVLSYGLLQLVYGPWSDRIGRRTVLLFGLLLTLLGSVLAALATELTTLVLARVLQGAGSAAGMVVGRALIQDLFQGPERTRVMAYVGMAMGLCPPLGTIVGGQLHVRLGWQANFVLMALLAALLCVAAWRGLPAHRPAAPSQAEPRAHWLSAMLGAYARLARDRRFVLYVGVLAVTSGTFYAFLGAAPLVLGSYGVGPDGIGFYIMFVPGSYIVGNFLTSHLVHRLGDQRMMWMGQALTVTGIGLMLALALAGFHSPLALALPLMLAGLGNGFLVPPALAGTVGLLPALAGSAAAVAGLMQQLAAALGGFAVGLVSHHNAVNLALVMMGLCGLGVLAQAGLRLALRPAARPSRFQA